MTIHRDHPFLPPEGQRNPLRQLRGRMPLPVTVWTTTAGPRPAGWTVSSLLLADGDPPELLGLVDEDSDFAALLPTAGRFAVSFLGWRHRNLADAFAGLAPAPGGPFRAASWLDTEWGPVLPDAVGWLGASLSDAGQHAGWALLVRGVVDRVEVAADAVDVLGYLRGRYRALELN